VAAIVAVSNQPDGTSTTRARMMTKKTTWCCMSPHREVTDAVLSHERRGGSSGRNVREGGNGKGREKRGRVRGGCMALEQM